MHTGQCLNLGIKLVPFILQFYDVYVVITLF